MRGAGDALPGGDDFAIALTGKLYDLLAAKGQPLPRAVGIALRQLMTESPAGAWSPGTAESSGGSGSSGGALPTGSAWSALSVATPALFGWRAAGLRLAAPVRVRADDYNAAVLKMSGFPPQPGRFVGRTGVMARASAALAAGSGTSGVLLHGMPGGGKTACALELAYTHENAFDRLVWFKAPDEGQDIRGALADFALTLESELPNFQMAHLLADEDRLAAFLPRLTELAERRRVLIVVDNIESLLTEGGQWRDDRWGKVVGALCAHRGLGRVILTSRRVPSGAGGAASVAGGDADGAAGMSGSLRVLAVDALSSDEALLLSRELLHLNTLIRGELPGVSWDLSRRLALGVLNVAQGHPKLLELADGQAAHPERLNELVAVGDSAWRDQGGLPDGFFSTGHARASAADYLHVLDAWTQSVAERLPSAVQTLFWFLCCLEEADRERPILDGNWVGLWTWLGLDGQPLPLDQALAALAAQGLTTVRPETGSEIESYAVHPGVAAAGRIQAGEAFRDAVDAKAAEFWHAVYRYASGETSDGGIHTGVVVRAGLAAVPYLIRRQQWTMAAFMLQQAFNRDPSRANATAVLPAIQEITDRDPDPVLAGVLATVLGALDPAAGERQMRSYLDAAVARGDYRAAGVAAGRLVNLCRDSGRLVEALTLAEQQIGYSRQAGPAGPGPWTQLLHEVQRLQVLTAMGQADRVLAEVQRLRGRMQDLPAARGPDETATPWNVRETLLDTGCDAARQLGRWQHALDLNAAISASMRGRSAPAADIALSRFKDYYPLLRLGRADETLTVLLECRQVFQDTRDTRMLGNTLGALADVEAARGHGDAAIGLARDALRYSHLAGDVLAIEAGYHNLGDYLHRHARQSAQAVACHLAAALICALTGAVGADRSVRAAATDLRALGAEDAEGPADNATGAGERGNDAAQPPGAIHCGDDLPPADVLTLCRQIGDISGADLARLLTALAPDPATADQTLRDLTAQAQAQAQATAPQEPAAPAPPE